MPCIHKDDINVVRYVLIILQKICQEEWAAEQMVTECNLIKYMKKLGLYFNKS